MRSLEDLAKEVLFGKTNLTKLLGKEYELRKGKTIADVKNAIRLGIKQGNGKTENEISMTEVHLQSVLKKKKQAAGSLHTKKNKPAKAPKGTSK